MRLLFEKRRACHRSEKNNRSVSSQGNLGLAWLGGFPPKMQKVEEPACTFHFWRGARNGSYRARSLILLRLPVFSRWRYLLRVPISTGLMSEFFLFVVPDVFPPPPLPPPGSFFFRLWVSLVEVVRTHDAASF